MFLEFLVFEIKLRLKSISTWCFFGLWVLLTFLLVGASNYTMPPGKTLINGPFVTQLLDFQLSFFGAIVIAAIFGTSILRDFQRDTYQIVFTKPVSKFAYLGGRWAGSFVTTLFAFSGMTIGAFLGTFAPWADHARIGPNHLWWYVQPFLSILVIQVFFMGSLF